MTVTFRPRQDTTARLEASGWTVLRFWERDIHGDADRIAEEIAAVVSARSAQL